MARRKHFIRHNKVTEMPQQAIWFDTESKTRRVSGVKEVHELTFGWACFRQRRGGGQWGKPQWLRFERASEFWDFVEEKQRVKTKTYIFCHNTSFDIPLLDGIRELAERGFKLLMAVIDAPPTILRYRRKGSTAVVLDTLNIFRMPLAVLGKQIGLEKHEDVDLDGNMIFDDKRCKRDVEIIMQACVTWWDFIKENDLGGFANTLAGQSMRAFRHRFMHHKILIDDNEDATAISRAAYYGGRTECFRLGNIKHQTWLFDVNSMYPAVMRGNLYPTVLVGHDLNPSIKDLEQWLLKYCCCADITLETTSPAYPVRRGSKLIFPTGTFRTVLATPELSRLLSLGAIKKVHAVAIYQRREIFTDFVDFFYAERQRAQAEGRTVDSLLYKILMNSLYGKFGQRGLIWEREKDTDDLTARSWEEYDLDTMTTTRYRQLGGLVQRQETESESKDSHPAIAAHVTAYARLLLWDMINTAGRENVYYVDTDSLLVNAMGKKRLHGICDAQRLGSLKEEATFKDAEIWGPKDYRFGEKRKTKGVKKSAVWTDKNAVTQQHWSTLKAHIRGGGTEPPSTHTVRKELKRQYNKGTVLKNGQVVPFELSEGDAPLCSGVKS